MTQLVPLDCMSLMAAVLYRSGFLGTVFYRSMFVASSPSKTKKSQRQFDKCTTSVWLSWNVPGPYLPVRKSPPGRADSLMVPNATDIAILSSELPSFEVPHRVPEMHRDGEDQRQTGTRVRDLEVQYCAGLWPLGDPRRVRPGTVLAEPCLAVSKVQGRWEVQQARSKPPLTRSKLIRTRSQLLGSLGWLLASPSIPQAARHEGRAHRPSGQGPRVALYLAVETKQDEKEGESPRERIV